MLTRELSEALEQQTAISEVLQVISSSLGELEPVFQAMLANATRLCEASYGAMWLREGDQLPQRCILRCAAGGIRGAVAERHEWAAQPLWAALLNPESRFR